MKKNLNFVLTFIAWNLFILFFFSAFISLINNAIESESLKTIHTILKLFNIPLYLMTVISFIVSIYYAAKTQEKHDIICFIYSVILAIFEILIIRGIYSYLEVFNQ